jgi:hypothetical protein
VDAIVNSIMPKKPAKLRPDVAETAFRVMQEAIGEAPKTLPPDERLEKNAEAVERGRRGGKRAAKTRETLTPEQRARGATVAALARWKKKD